MLNLICIKPILYHYAYKYKVERELERLVNEPVDSSDWEALRVPIIKIDKESVRVCGDFRVTVHQFTN